MFFLYTLNNPDTLEIRYVWFTNRAKTRLWEHIRDAKKGIKTYKSYWIKSLLDQNKIPIMNVVKECDSHDQVAVEEINLIAELKSNNVRLTNLTDGGGGQLGVKLRPDHPIIMWNKGREKSEETRRKLSESHKNVKLSEYHRSRISIGKLGKKRGSESIEKQSKTRSQPLVVITPSGDSIEFLKMRDAVKFTGCEF